VWQSLRVRLPLFLTLYCGVVGLVLFTVANELQEAAFERDFERAELVRATEIQSRTERAAERSELETGQREFGELAVFEDIRAAVFVAPDNQVVLSSRRDWIGRPVDIAALALAPAEHSRIEETMRRVRANGRTESLFSLDRNSLTFVLPATVPVSPGELGATREALILLVHDLTLSKAVNRQRLLRQFGVAAVAVFLAVLGLGISLQALVTRRIERLHDAMGRFAQGAPIDRGGGTTGESPIRGYDEIAELHRHFNDIAATARRESAVRRHAEDALRDSEERFRSAMHYSPIGMALVSTSGEYLEVNPALCAIVGYTQDELLSMGFDQITHADDLPGDRVATDRLLKRNVETIRRVKRYHHKDGRIRWVQVNSSLVLDDVGKPRYFVSQIQDITERKRADEDLQHANRALQTISNCNQVLVHATDEAGLLNEICHVMVRDGGYRVAWVGFAESGFESAVRTVAIASDEIDGASRIAWATQGGGQMAAAIRTGEPAVCADFHAAGAAGPWRDEAIRLGYRSCIALPLVADGRAIGAIALCSGEEAAFDVAEATLLKELADDLAFGIVAMRTRANQRQAEEALRTANERYARQEAALTTLTRSSISDPDDFAGAVREITEVVASTLSVGLVGVWRHDERGASMMCQDLFQWPDGIHTAGLERTEEAFPTYFRALAGAEVLAVTDARSDPRTSEVAAQLSSHHVVSMMCVPIRSRGASVGVLSCKHMGELRRWMPDEQAFALTVANLLSTLIGQAERQRLEQQLRQAQKLEAIGRLAGGVAHDFNNILTVILGRAEEVATDSRVPGDLREAVADLSQNADRASALTRQLLAFSRRQTIEVRDVDLNGVVANVTRLLHRVLGEDIEVSFIYSDVPLAVRADPGMIEQVLLNLAVNARDAMPGGGRLSIDTSFVEDGGQQSANELRGQWACLRVRDNGGGIAPEHLPHIFEPFFTTKDVGKGTGLGLATTYGIVQQHGGWIEVNSHLGRGTEFRVFFPRVDVESPATSPAEPPAPRPRGEETILVVEDEAGVRALVKRLLEDLGYRVLQAQSGPHAVDVWQDHGDEVDLLITDIVMPDGMNGVDLAERLRGSRPALKVIYTSGYMADLSREDLSRHHADAYIAKPFSLTDLARLVRRTLDGGEHAAAPVSRDA
jgi:PAS domain S-box-containing protein